MNGFNYRNIILPAIILLVVFGFFVKVASAAIQQGELYNPSEAAFCNRDNYFLHTVNNKTTSTLPIRNIFVYAYNNFDGNGFISSFLYDGNEMTKLANFINGNDDIYLYYLATSTTAKATSSIQCQKSGAPASASLSGTIYEKEFQSDNPLVVTTSTGQGITTNPVLATSTDAINRHSFFGITSRNGAFSASSSVSGCDFRFVANNDVGGQSIGCLGLNNPSMVVSAANPSNFNINWANAKFSEGSAAPAISMAWPVNGTTTPDFTFWVLSGENLEVTSSSDIGVLFGKSSGNYIFSNFKRYSGQLDTVARTQVFKTIKLSSTTTSVWYAKPFWVSGLDLVFGDEITFSVSSTLDVTPYNFQVVNNPNSAIGLAGVFGNDIYPQNYLFGQEPQYNTTSTAPFSCGTDVNEIFSSSTLRAIGCQTKLTAREVLEWLFIPTTGKVWLNNAYNETKTRFPFNIYYSVVGSFQTAITTSSKVTDKTISFPIFNTSFTIISSSTMENFIGTANKNLVFDVQSALFYAAAGLIALSIFF